MEEGEAGKGAQGEVGLWVGSVDAGGCRDDDEQEVLDGDGLGFAAGAGGVDESADVFEEALGTDDVDGGDACEVLVAQLGDASGGTGFFGELERGKGGEGEGKRRRRCRYRAEVCNDGSEVGGADEDFGVGNVEAVLESMTCRSRWSGQREEGRKSEGIVGRAHSAVPC